MDLTNAVKGALTNAIINVAFQSPRLTATEIAHKLDHDPAVVSGILARLDGQRRVSRRMGGPRLANQYAAPLHDWDKPLSPAASGMALT